MFPQKFGANCCIGQFTEKKHHVGLIRDVRHGGGPKVSAERYTVRLRISFPRVYGVYARVEFKRFPLLQVAPRRKERTFSGIGIDLNSCFNIATAWTARPQHRLCKVPNDKVVKTITQSMHSRCNPGYESLPVFKAQRIGAIVSSEQTQADSTAHK
ncbi:hypothetical protein DBV15_04555 [Temnothorax longispinosus]|uniref:Uncharacterized protein n=1 Tax=Temnothorax longispinosus TaxID=300112 RepID=A0A4S2KFG9_9HYME|nr:hypothetical protein DBV15_04555 [Temnothorax longispinosus]